jgi:hypothetical protein
MCLFLTEGQESKSSGGKAPRFITLCTMRGRVISLRLRLLIPAI